MGWVAVQLDDLVGDVGVSLSESLAFVEASLELIGLHVKLIEGLAAALAVERVIVHQVLNAANHDRV